MQRGRGLSAMTALRLLALGDSYTIGEGVAENQRWPMQFCAALRALGVDSAEPRIIAETGWTTDELSAAIDAAEPPVVDGVAPWDQVSLLVGVNNQYRGRSLDNYREEFSALLDRAIGYAGYRPDRVFVLSIPDWGVTPFGQGCGRDTQRIAADIDAFNAASRDIADARGVFWLDITELTREYGARPDMVVADGLHPSGAMYAMWVEKLMDSLP